MQYQFSGADSDCFIMGRSLCQCLLLNAQSQFFWIETVHGQIHVSGLEEGTPYRLVFPNGLHDWLRVQSRLFLVMVNVRVPSDDDSLLNPRL